MAEPRHPATVVSGAAGASVDVEQRARRQAALAGLAFASAGAAPVDAQHTQSRHLAFLPPETLDLDLSNPAHRDFGDYELQGKLGQGGMGVVYRARQKSLEREVALKLLAAGPWASADFIARFRREAQSAARMQHPNIVPIYEIGAHEELNFFSMMLVRGPTLGQVLAEQGPFEPRAAAQMVRTIAEALDYAHRLGVLHLDLKPGNVLIDERGVPLVADFGLARRIDEALATDNDEVSGTPSYMAPEQAQIKSHKLTPATDIYGIGAILYELLTGRPPFLAATPQETLKRVVTQEPARPRSLRRQVSQDLEAVALKCLAKDPKQRYASARALADDLGRYLDGRAVSVRPLNAAQRLLRWARREPRVALALGAFVFALASGLVATAVQWRRADAHAVEARDRTWNLRAQAAQAALAEGDGFAALRPLIANLAEMEAAGRGADAAVERQRIGTLLANAPRLIDLVAAGQGQSIHALALSPRGDEFAVTLHSLRGERAVRVYEVASGRERWTTSTEAWTPALPWAGMMHGWLRYSPDGSRLVATMPHQSPFPYPRVADAMPLDVASGELLRPPAAGPDLYDLVASDDVRYALVRWRSDPSHRFPDSGQFHAIDGWKAIGPRHRFEAGLQTDSWLPAPDGSVWLGTSGSSKLTLYELGTMAVRWRLELPLADPVRGWRFSSDGAQLAIGTSAGRVHLVDVRDGGMRELPSAPAATVRWLEFSPDGRTLAARAENATIAVWDLPSGRARVTPIADARAAYGAVALLDDSLYSAGRSGLQAFALPPVARYDNDAVAAPARIRNRRGFWLHGFGVHEDSRLLAAAGTDGQVGLWRLPPPALRRSQAAPLPAHSQHFDGLHLYAVDGHRVQRRDVITEAPASAPFEFPDPVRLAEPSPDGRYLAVVAGRTLRVIEPDSGRLVGAPIVLPQVPLRADLAAAAPVMALTTGEYDGDRFRERIHVVDLDRGALRSSALASDGPIEAFRLAPDGRRLLLTQWNLSMSEVSLVVHALDGGPGCAELAIDDFNQAVDFAFVAGTPQMWMYASLTQRRSAMLRVDLERCAEVGRIPMQHSGTASRLLPSGDAVVAHRQSGNLLTTFRADGSRHDVPGMTRDQPNAGFALSADGRRAVVSSRNAVQLIDLARGEQLSGLLAAPIAGDDAITMVMLAPDGGTILARSLRGRWLAWRVPSTPEDVDRLGRLATLLDPRNEDPPLEPAALEALRPVLRAADPPVPAPTPDPAPLRYAADPAAAPDPRFVPIDLAPGANVVLRSGWPGRGGMGGDTPTMPAGPQRLHGIDWHVDRGIQLSWGGAAVALHPTQRASGPIPVPGIAARKVHALVLIHIPIDVRNGNSRAATVVLLDRDGKETELEIQMVRDVVTRGLPQLAGPSARIGWVGLSGADIQGGDGNVSEPLSFAYAVSLEVPAGTGPVHALRVETRDGPMEAPLFLAITLETEPPAG